MIAIDESRSRSLAVLSISWGFILFYFFSVLLYGSDHYALPSGVGQGGIHGNISSIQMYFSVNIGYVLFLMLYFQKK